MKNKLYFSQKPRVSKTQFKQKGRLKFLALALLLSLTLGTLFACTPEQPKDSGRIKIVVSSFPQYDWVREVMSEQVERADITLLTEKGIDPHSFQPSTKDFLAISNADLFIYGGGVSDSWAADALKNAANKNMITLNLVETLGEGVKLVGAAEETEQGHAADDGHDHANEIDEHVWMSLKNAKLFTSQVADALGTIDPDFAGAYKANAEGYGAELLELDALYSDFTDNPANKLLIIADRFPFRYLFDDYGLKYRAAFDGCSADFEASFDTIIGLAKLADENAQEEIIVTETSNKKVANALIENSKMPAHEILVLDSMQSVSRADIDAGKTYLDTMKLNYNTLGIALQNWTR